MFFYYKLLLIFIGVYIYREVFSYNISLDQIYLIEFTYYEFISYLAFGFVLFLIVYFFFLF
jgi:hypothetical protein